MEKPGKFGHHPDETIDAEVEVERLVGQLTEAQTTLLMVLDLEAVTAPLLNIKEQARYVLKGMGMKTLGCRGVF